MEIRYASEDDQAEIIAVLKASLGETSSKKNSEIWMYKHIMNPFGRSLVMVAVEDDKIVGVRAFMKWKWQLLDQQFNAYRAVDTATHPDYRGRGIFKKLTLEAVLEGVKNDGHFVFNTPNSQSRPGYLKMGWEEVNKVAVELIPFLPFKKVKKYPDDSQSTAFNKITSLLLAYNDRKRKKNKLFTPKDVNYLKWRYLENPLQEYIISFDEDYFCATYIKRHKYFKELRVSEAIFDSEAGKQKITHFIKETAAEYKAFIISRSVSDKKLFPISYKGNVGPILTLRKLKIEQENFNYLMQIKKWDYSLGDLELF